MRPKVTDIQRIVAAYFNVSLDKMLGKSHEPFYAHPRQIAVYIARKVGRHSYPRLGIMFDRDHTTMVYAVREVERRMVDDENLERDIKTLLKSITRAVEKCGTASDAEKLEAA
jgi:chromosomal replication initiator protein